MKNNSFEIPLKEQKGENLNNTKFPNTSVIFFSFPPYPSVMFTHTHFHNGSLPSRDFFVSRVFIHQRDKCVCQHTNVSQRGLCFLHSVGLDDVIFYRCLSVTFRSWLRPYLGWLVLPLFQSVLPLQFSSPKTYWVLSAWVYPGCPSSRCVCVRERDVFGGTTSYYPTTWGYRFEVSSKDENLKKQKMRSFFTICSHVWVFFTHWTPSRPLYKDKRRIC